MRGRRFAAGTAVAVVMLVVATAFAVPYRDADRRVDIPALAYVGAIDGGGSLRRQVEADGSTTWSSSTTGVVPDLAVGSVDSAIRDSILDRAGIDPYIGELPGVDVVVGYEVDRPETGPRESRVVTSMADEAGVALVAVAVDGGDAVVFTPPLPLLPTDPRAGSVWEESGTLGAATYDWTAEVVEAGPVDAELASFDDCLTVESTLGTESADGTRATDRYVDVYCRGVGSVRSSYDSDTDGTDSVTVAATGHPPVDSPPLPGVEPVAAGPELGEEDWTVSTLVHQAAGVTTPRPAAVPELAPTDPPLLMVSTEGTVGLEAVRTAGSEDETARAWRHATAGTAYGGILADDEGRVFAGSSSGTVHAMTTDGLFLWATDVGDNVATRPALASDTLVVGSEDGDVVGLDPDTGEVRWRLETGGPVTAGGAAVDDLVIIGGDDGTLLAVEAATGAVRWSHELGDPIEAPVTDVGDGTVLAATRGGDVVRLDTDGVELWTASTFVPIGTAPTVSGGVVAVAVGDFGGDLVGLDLDSGEQRWQLVGDHVGPVAAIEGRASFVAAESDGTLLALDAEGREVTSWEVPPITGDASLLSQLSVGPIVGAGALWMVDDIGRVLRLGPSAPGVSTAQDVAPVWVKTTADRPFVGASLRATPLVEGDDVYVIDGDGELYALDPASGDAQRTGRIEIDGLVVLPAPVDDGIAYIAAQSTVAAVELPTGEVRWQARVRGTALQRVTIADDALVVSTTARRDHHVSVFDLATGELRWEARTGRVAIEGFTIGATVADDLVLTGDPFTARSIEDGEVAWRSDARDTVGAQALIDGGRTVVAGTGRFEAGRERGATVAVDVATGEVQWEADLPVGPDPLADVLVGEGDGGELVVLQLADMTGVVGVDGSDGSVLWERQLPTLRLGSGALLEGLVWLPLRDGRVLALDPGTGDTVARSPDLGVDLSDQGLVQRPVEVDGTVLVSVGLAMFGLDAAVGG